MGISGGVRVDGLTRLTRGLVDLGVELDDLKDTFAGIADAGAKKAASLAPRRTGALAAGIRGNRAKNKAIVRAGSARLRYAAVQNYGWPRRHITGVHFMQKADEALRPVALDMLDKGIERAIRKADLK